MENLDKKQLQYEAAVERVNKIKRFYRHVFVFFIIFILINGRHFYKFGDFSINRISLVWIIWGTILTINGIKLFVLNSDWESKMINKEIKKQEYHGNL